MEYNFREIEKKWQKAWRESGVYQVSNTPVKPKFYVLDMFPYPSGVGLHVGHPLGYIASDIYARYKRLKGFNVLHPMGYDSFGLPAEQYALETGQHPAVTTEKNIETYRQQLDSIGFCFDWSRELRTSDPKYYKWTQWIFLQIFNSWYDRKEKKARRIEALTQIFEKHGNGPDNGQRQTQKYFSANEWNNYTDEEKQEALMEYRIAFSAFGEVNWCEALGTVLANDEVINGVSERGGHPVVKRKMRQWYLRITDYAERLLEGLETVEFTDAMKEMQRNWIGKSDGAEMEFLVQKAEPEIQNPVAILSEPDVYDSEFIDHHPVAAGPHMKVRVYTTRPDTIFGVDFMVLAPEHELLSQIVTPGQKQEIEKYITYVQSRSERERMAEVKSITGAFTGAYAINPFDDRRIPIWISEYVLAGYGTGAIMAVPCGDQRDYDFARHFKIPITNIIGEYFNGNEANPTKEAVLSNSGFLNGLKMQDAIRIVLDRIENEGIGHRKVNYKMRDAGFSRQRYWGEPFPIIYKNGVAFAVDEKELPVELPYVETYSPGPEGEGPLANIPEWVNIVVSSPSANEDLTHVPSPEERGEENADRIISDPSSWKELKPYARENRKNQTPAENLLWENIRNRNISDCKFRRQDSIGGFIVDFVCIEKKLILEVDGGDHLDDEQKKYDESRTEYLNEQGFNELRFSNDEVLHDISKVLDRIRKGLEASSPLSRRGVRGEVWKRETNTMPGYAGSSWYFLRYMDPHNETVFADQKAMEYWNQVDVYVGGTEHAVGHLLYSRMWTKVLCDLGYINFDEPYKKLVNQGMIQGSSRFVYRILWHGAFDPAFNTSKLPGIFLSKRLRDGLIHNEIELIHELNSKLKEILHSNGVSVIPNYTITALHVDVNIVDGVELDIDSFRSSKSEYSKATLILESGQVLSPGEDLGAVSSNYICGTEVEKMSKSKFNTVNPNMLVEKYGADTFRMYEMFLGPVEQSKPWDTKGIEGVHRFLKKLWRLFYDDVKGQAWNEEKATDAELKVLHKTIKKVEEDTERFSYNTAVSAFMVCVNELTDLKCHKKEVLEPLLILLTPYAPHIAEELYATLGNTSTIIDAAYPRLELKYLVESEKEYPVSINGKLRTTITISLDASQDEVEKIALGNEIIQKWMEGKPPKKIIFVKNKMVNVVV